MLDTAPVTAGELMTADVAFVHPETSLLAAVKLMAARQVSGLPVLDRDGRIVGMVSEGDLLRWHEEDSPRLRHWLEALADGYELAPEFVARIRDGRNTVRAVMVKDVVTVPETMPARDVAALLHDRGIKRVPVVRDGRMVGIVARSDLVRALARKLDEAAQKPA